KANVAAGGGARRGKTATLPSKAAVRPARRCGKSAGSGVIAEGGQTGEAGMGGALRHRSQSHRFRENYGPAAVPPPGGVAGEGVVGSGEAVSFWKETTGGQSWPARLMGCHRS